MRAILVWHGGEGGIVRDQVLGSARRGRRGGGGGGAKGMTVVYLIMWEIA